MAILIGVGLALAVGAFTSLLGMDRERGLYPAVTMVIGGLYSLFATMGAPSGTILHEALAGSVFIALAAWGYRTTLWIVVAALAGHATFDLFHEALIPDPGVPSWWPDFCGPYDYAAAAYLAILLRTGRVAARAAGKVRATA